MFSDQLTAYALAHPEAEQVALCVFVKTAKPRIDWHTSERGSVHLAEYLSKIRVIGGAVTAGHFYRRPGWWCGMCDYLAVCLGDEQKIREVLVQVAPASC